MQFFEHQDEARGRTTLLISLFAVAVLGLVGMTCLVAHFALSFDIPPGKPLRPDHWSTVALAGAATLIVIVLGAAYRLAQLSGGGYKVAETLGGSLISPGTTDPLERRVINVVEEMAIAAGMPVPPVYLMKGESGINAFAAGWSPDDAVIGVTQGTLEGLNREQLQGVIAHEFSHVLNRDCALNMRLLGVLHGIVLISLIGQILFRLGVGSSDNRRGKGMSQFAFIGGAIWLFGVLGVFVARLIQAAVSKQREYLADASAVQFTRNPEGIAGALATIGTQGSAMTTARGGEVEHMLIGAASRTGFMGLFASHPPLDQRIQRILPNWKGDLAQLATPPGSVMQALHRGDEDSKSVRAAPPDPMKWAVLSDVVLSDVALGAGAALGGTQPVVRSSAPAVASKSAPQVSTQPVISHAAELLANIPADLRSAAASPFSARALVLAWVMDDQHEQRLTQLALLGGDSALAAETERLLRLMPSLDPIALLPLFDVAVGTLAGLSERQKQEFSTVLQTVEAQLSHDAYRSYCLAAIVLRRINPRERPHKGRPALVKDAIETMLGVLAVQGHGTAQAAEQAFAAGIQRLGNRGESLQLRRPQDLGVPALKAAFGAVLPLPHNTRAELLNAAEAIAGFDGVVRPREAELLRAMATCLNIAAQPAFATASI